MAEAVIDEVLDGDEGLGHVAGAKGEGEGLSLEEVADDEDFFEVSNVIPNRRLSRKVASDYSRWGRYQYHPNALLQRAYNEASWRCIS